MKAVGVKELKARLSEYLRLVRTGETVLVTDRNEVVAELRPAHRQSLGPPSIEQALERMADEGRVVLRASESGDWPSPSTFPRLEGVDSAKLLDQLRRESGDRD
jgi:prevent-host-death family protein